MLGSAGMDANGNRGGELGGGGMSCLVLSLDWRLAGDEVGGSDGGGCVESICVECLDGDACTIARMLAPIASPPATCEGELKGDAAAPEVVPAGGLLPASLAQESLSSSTGLIV